MVEHDALQLNDIFHALSDETRRSMLHALATRERTVTELAVPFAMSLAAASKHVKTLERAGLIERTVVGRTHTCRLQPERLADADRWLALYEHLWNHRFDRLDALLQRTEEENDQS